MYISLYNVVNFPKHAIIIKDKYNKHNFDLLPLNLKSMLISVYHGFWHNMIQFINIKSSFFAS
jgi:hypothetical protein